MQSDFNVFICYFQIFQLVFVNCVRIYFDWVTTEKKGKMPGGNICDENLEQRIERIRKRDEEIEKRHREAEADRLAALQANAMVKTTAPADDDDWPKAHKYDKLDFTYDVKCDQIDGDEKKSADETRLQRPFRQFPEGEGPPSDPKFNFLADAERDGKIQGANAVSETKNWRASNNSSTNSNRRNNSNNSSFNRGRNGGGKGVKSQADMKKGKPNDEPIMRNSDRERNNEQRMQRQKSSDGMWRRASEETKEIKRHVSHSPANKSVDNHPATALTADANAQLGANKATMQQRMDQSKIESENIQQQLSDLSIEKRGNITVSVTKDGEVKSVKCMYINHLSFIDCSVCYSQYDYIFHMYFLFQRNYERNAFSGSSKSNWKWPCRWCFDAPTQQQY